MTPRTDAASSSFDGLLAELEQRIGEEVLVMVPDNAGDAAVSAVGVLGWFEEVSDLPGTRVLALFHGLDVVAIIPISAALIEHWRPGELIDGPADGAPNLMLGRRGGGTVVIHRRRELS